MPPGYTLDSLRARPFHIYDTEFATVLGASPSLTLVSKTASDPVFHEAVVWSRRTDEVFFVQNAGSPASGTGLNKSAIIQKISLADAAAASAARAAGSNDTLVAVTVVDASPAVINPNGKSAPPRSHCLGANKQAPPTSAARSSTPARARATTSHRRST